MKKITILISTLILTVTTSVAQTWNIGASNDKDVTATLSNGTLTIKGTGDMRDFDYYNPWSKSYDHNTSITKIVIEGGVTNISKSAFAYFKSLTEVIIPNSVKNIENEAFKECSGLTTIIIPEGVTSIGDVAFSNCHSLTEIIIPKSVTKIGDYAFASSRGLTKVTMLEGVVSIGRYAFSDCENLMEITIPNSVTTIGETAFYKCSKLTEVNIPSSLTSIQGHVFYGCSGLTAITIPSGVTSIGEYAFCSCEGLTKVIIPKSVTSIGKNAFTDCENLTEVTNFASTPQILPYNAWDGGVFDGVWIRNVTLNVPAASVDLYKAAREWRDFKITGMEIIGTETAVQGIVSAQISIYPNPTIGVVNISEPSEIKVYSLQGALLYETFGTQVDLSAYPKGVYQLYINGEVVKVVKK
ncbi:MAG: leucine-rich repeat protein [Bacteroidetes bacterium]|nr:leucine-rich repeat protein [Bacteroidota bacterium]